MNWGNLSKGWGLGVFMAVFGICQAQETWVDRTASAGLGGILSGVAYGDGSYVAVGTNGAAATIFRSSDGISWEIPAGAPEAGARFNGLAYASSRFVAVGTTTAAALIASSQDSVNWTLHEPSVPGIGGELMDVAFGNDTWVAVGTTGGGLAAVATSTDGVNWQARSTVAGISGVLESVIYAGSQFVAVGWNGAFITVATSPDGQNWTDHTLSVNIRGKANGISYFDGQYTVTGDGTPSGGTSTAHVLSSSDGVVWENRTLSAGLGGIGLGIASNAERSVLVGRTGGPGLLAESGDGQAWTNQTTALNAPGELRDITHGSAGWVAVGTNLGAGVVVTSGTAGGGGSEPTFGLDELRVSHTGGIYEVPVYAGSDVDWSVSTDSSWVFILSGTGEGTGYGTVTLSIGFQSATEPRTAQLAMGGETLTIVQSGFVPSAPSLRGSTDPEENAVILTWNPPAGADTMEIQRREELGGAFRTMANPGAATGEYTDTSVSGARTYQYRARASVDAGWTDWSAVITVSLPPDIPGGFTATARNASQIELTWNDVGGETGYALYRSDDPDAGFFSIIGEVGQDETRYIDTGLDSQRTYFYAIESLGGVTRRQSAAVHATTPAREDSISWISSSESNAKDLLGVAHGNGRTVAVGRNGLMVTSTDGENWETLPRPQERTLRAVGYSNGRFTAVGNAGVVLSSANGLDWQIHAVPVTQNLVAVASLGQLWMVVGEEGAVLTSTDGLNWTGQSSPAEQGWTTVFSSEDRFIAIETSGRFLSADESLEWSEVRAPLPPENSGLEPFFWTRTAGAFGDGIYSVVGPASHVSSSPDGTEWSELSPGGFDYYEAVAYQGGQFVAVGINGIIARSTDGSAYFYITNLPETLNAVCATGSGFVTVGDRGLIAASTDAFAWETVREPEGSRANLKTILAGEDRVVVFGQTDFESVSLLNLFDGAGWTESTFEVPGLEFMPDIEDGLWTRGRFFAVGSNGLIAASPDGETWSSTVLADLAQDAYRSIAASPERILTGPGADQLSVSFDDGASWSPVPDLPSDFRPWTLLAEPRWIGLGAGFGNLNLWYSDNGEDWSRSRVGGQADYVSTLARGNYDEEPLVVGAGTSFDDRAQVMTSWDGRNWTARSDPPFTGSIEAVAHGNGVFVAVSSLDSEAALWASVDGVSWEEPPPGFLPDIVYQLGGFRDIAYYDDRFIAVGGSGLVMEMVIASGDHAFPATFGIPATAAISGSQLTITWTSTAGASYQVLHRESMTAGSWAAVGAPVDGDGGDLSRIIDLTGLGGSGYWAVVESTN